MIAEAKSYAGVSCFRCGSEIPVSERIVDIQDEIERGMRGVPYAFRARCRMCEYETIYEIGKFRGLTENHANEPQEHGHRLPKW